MGIEIGLRNADILKRLVPAMDVHSPAGKRATDVPCQLGACECLSLAHFRNHLPDEGPFVNNFKRHRVDFFFFQKELLLILCLL